MDLNDDDWFFLRFNPTVPPLLNMRNSVLQTDVYRWWKSLQSESSKANYTDVVDILFSLFPDEEHYSDAGPDRCRTCAVVGNSGNLLASHYGQLIDSHDFVIRINKGPTKGFEKDVGSKTTHRILYPESAVDVDNSTHLVLLPFKIEDMRWLISVFTTRHITNTYIRVRPSVNADRDKVMIIHPVFIKYVYESWLQKHGKYPSTGFITLIFALHICDQVNVFGFGAKSDGHWHHYFDAILTHFSRGVHLSNFNLSLTAENMVPFTKWRYPYITGLFTFSILFLFMFFQNAVIYNFLKTSVDSTKGGLCACDNCVMDLNDDDWFFLRFNPTVPPLLNMRNSVLQTDVYRWWKMWWTHCVLSSPMRNTTQTLVQIAIEPVGNSGNLLPSHEKDVGSKTTHRILYPESAVDVDNSTHLVLLPFKIEDMRWLISVFTTRHIGSSDDRVKIAQSPFRLEQPGASERLT
ncbi:unnamed protein product [Leuciscus chuanchicus]